MPQPTAQHTHTLQLTRTFAAPRERIFAAWTTPEELKRWSAPGELTNPVVEVDLRVGGRYRIEMRAPDGTTHVAVGVYREVDPPRRLQYTWRWEREGAEETLVTVEFEERGGRTAVTLTHEGHPSEDERRNHEQGWTGCLVKLEQLFAGS